MTVIEAVVVVLCVLIIGCAWVLVAAARAHRRDEHDLTTVLALHTLYEAMYRVHDDGIAWIAAAPTPVLDAMHAVQAVVGVPKTPRLATLDDETTEEP